MTQDSEALKISDEKAKDRRKPLIFRLYNWYDRYDSWRGRIDWILGFFKAHAASTIAAVGTTTAAATVATVAIVNPQYFDRMLGRSAPLVEAPAKPVKEAAAPAPVKVETNKWGDATIYPIEGRDTAGRQARFDVAVLPKDITWQRKDSEHLARDGAAFSGPDAISMIFVPEFLEGLNRSQAVMAVGVASQEGDVNEEAERAQRRAQTAASWLDQVLPATSSIWTLNLGQYKGSCAVGETADTAWQRPVLMIGIRQQEPGVDLGEALGNAMAGKSNLPARSCYSHFQLTRSR